MSRHWEHRHGRKNSGNLSHEVSNLKSEFISQNAATAASLESVIRSLETSNDRFELFQREHKADLEKLWNLWSAKFDELTRANRPNWIGIGALVLAIIVPASTLVVFVTQALVAPVASTTHRNELAVTDAWKAHVEVVRQLEGLKVANQYQQRELDRLWTRPGVSNEVELSP